MSVDITRIRQYISGDLTDPLNPNDLTILPTSAIYSGDYDGYTAERTVLHDAIVAQHIKTRTLGDKKQLIVIAGGMSVGTTSMLRLLENDNVIDRSAFCVITPMSISSLPEFRERDHYQHPEKSPLLVAEYYHIIQKIAKAAVERGLSLALLEMGDRSGDMLTLLDDARQRGYATAIIGLSKTVEEYFAAATSWQDRFGRIADYYRGLCTIRDFSKHWEHYTSRFDISCLVEPEYTEGRYHVHLLMLPEVNDRGGFSLRIVDQDKYDRFILRRFINVNANTAVEAMAYAHKPASQQLTTLCHPARPATAGRLDPLPSKTDLHAKLHALCSDTLSQRYEAIVRSKTEERSRQAAERLGDSSRSNP